ncbi:MAG: DNA methyltransferase [Planctomycetaceae bacterium]
MSNYADIPAITTYIVPQKQAVKRHYGSHQYFTKRAWNVIQAYIKRFTQPGDVVCDPYGGTGVTIVEALGLGRKGIYLDISEWATFLARQIAVAPVDLDSLGEAFAKVEKACEKPINRWWALTADEIHDLPLTRWYPKDVPLPRNADVTHVEDLFTHRQLLALSELYHHIQRVKNRTNRELLRYAFSATLYMCNRTFISANNRIESRGGSSIFSIYRYKVAKRTIELNPWTVFSRRFVSLVKAKKDTNKFIGEVLGASDNGIFQKGYAQELTQYVEPESVDYIFTDPPYGSHIAYLDLTRMWDAWLGFETTTKDLQEETIESGDARHSPEHFRSKLADGIDQMFKILKYDRWMSLVFAHREPAMWDSVVKAAEAAGFEYVNTVAQPLNVIWSMHKKKNPLTVVSGELILNFRKVRNPRTLAITSIGSDAVSIIKDSAELSIVVHEGATTDQIYADLIPKLLENGLLGEVSSTINDLTPLLHEGFQFDKENKTWHVKPGRKLGCHIPLDHRIRFYVVDFLNHAARLGKRATIDDIAFHVLPKLKNGHQPRKQRIVEELRKVAVPIEKKYWVLRTEQQNVFEFALADIPTGRPLSLAQKPEGEYGHNEILAMIADIGIAAGFGCHIGKRERETTPSLADVSAKTLPFLRGQTKSVRSVVQQIDVLWLDAKRPEFAFEVEHTTSITTALDRFLELLKAEKLMAERLVIVAPKSRRRKLDQVLSSSHYIGAPMYLDRKVRYLWYADVLKLAARFSVEQPTKPTLAGAIVRALHSPRATSN